MFMTPFRKTITKNEARESVEEAISKMMRYFSFDLEHVEGLKGLYDDGRWDIEIGSEGTRIGVSPDYSEIKRVTTSIPKDRLRAKGSGYHGVAYAYLYSRSLERMRSQIKEIKSQNNYEFFTTLQSYEEKWDYNLRPVSHFIVDRLLRDDEKSLMKYRSQNYSKYYPFLVAEERYGFEDVILKGSELLNKKDVKPPDVIKDYRYLTPHGLFL